MKHQSPAAWLSLALLIAGGTLAGDRVTASMEIFDPASNVFTAAPDLAIWRRTHTAVMLADGRVLIAGGYDRKTQATASAWLYR